MECWSALSSLFLTLKVDWRVHWSLNNPEKGDIKQGLTLKLVPWDTYKTNRNEIKIFSVPESVWGTEMRILWILLPANYFLSWSQDIFFPKPIWPLAFLQKLENISEWTFYPKLFQTFSVYYYGQYFLSQAGILSAPKYICFSFSLMTQYNNLEA